MTEILNHSPSPKIPALVEYRISEQDTTALDAVFNTLFEKLAKGLTNS